MAKNKRHLNYSHGVTHSQILVAPIVRLSFLLLAAVNIIAACVSGPLRSDSEPISIPASFLEPGSETRLASEELEREDQNLSDKDKFSDGNFVQIGRGQLVNQNSFSPKRHSVKGDREVSLAFNDAPIHEVVNQVVAEMMGADFFIDPDVTGTITLRTATPVKISNLPTLLDQALNLSGFSMIKTAQGAYSILSIDKANSISAPLQLASDKATGNNIVLPLRHVSVSNMLTLLEPLIPPELLIRGDNNRQHLLIKGQQQHVQSVIETVKMFDVDWLKEMSFAIFEVKNATATEVVDDLIKVTGGEDGLLEGQLEFVALRRLNAVLVIAKNAKRLSQIKAWIGRLDAETPDSGRKFRVLAVQNADAEKVADTLNSLFLAEDASVNSAGGDGASTISVGQRSSPSLNAQSVRIQAEPATNSLITFATTKEFQQIRSLLDRIDVLPDQVLIEVVIAEVTLNDDLRYGVQWFFDSRTEGQLTLSDAAAGSVGARFPGFAYTFAGNYIQAALNALSDVTDIEVVSSPQIVTQDNQTATLQVGDQVPVVTQSAVSVQDPAAPIVNSVQYRDTGILLNVTPRINDSNVVVLDISQEVSNAVPTQTSGIDAPTIQQRQFDSTVSIYDGQTLALGGLIRTATTTGKSGIPGLKNIPVIGNGFSTSSDNRSRTELVIFLSPKIIRSRSDIQETNMHIAQRLNQLKILSLNKQ